MAKKREQLTPKQEAFAVFYVQLGNAAEAYRRAFEKDPDARDSWIYVEAYQLLEHPKVAPRIKQLQEAAKKAGQYTVEKAAEELEDARQLAHQEGQAGPAVSAVNAKIKLYGIDKPSRVEVSGPNGAPIPTSFKLAGLSDEELAQLERLTDKVRNQPGVGEED
ncbi:MAG: terminase small subunit [Pseudomonadota bacterium]